MDPILEEMQRANEVQYGRFRSWTQYLCALVAAKDDEIATLKRSLADMEGAQDVITAKRGPGRPRKTEAVNG